MAVCLLLTRRGTKGAPLLFFQAIAFRLNRNTMFQSLARMFNDRFGLSWCKNNVPALHSQNCQFFLKKLKPKDPTTRLTTSEKNRLTMKKITALTLIAIASQVLSASAGEPVASSKEVVTPPPPPPISYFRSNEFSLGLFGSYGVSFNNNVRAIGDHAWGGGVDGEYFPLQYLGLAVEGNFFNELPGSFFGSTVTGNVILRYPLDTAFPGFHLAPYAFGGVGGIFNQNNALTRIATAGNQNRLNRSGADDEVLGDVGVGLEYRFTPHIGLFSDARYNFVNGPKNNFLGTRVGLRFAF